MLKDKHIVLGVTGSIAAYKAAELASRLAQEGALVEVIMTRSAQEFVAPLTFQTLTQRPVITEMFQLLSEMNIAHVALAQRADLVLIAPATANTIAKLAHGLADDMLSATVLATRAPVLIAPAMETNMYENPVTQANLASLVARGMTVVEPEVGHLVSGRYGKGRMADPAMILALAKQALGRDGDLAGRRVVVTAGGTQEPLDPVRFVGNRSSGKMGYALAQAALERGAQVTLISAPTRLSPPPGAKMEFVTTAAEMRDAVMGSIVDADALIMAAAVADYRPAEVAPQKIKKNSRGLTLRLRRNPDILMEVAEYRRSTGKPSMVVGFAAETEDLAANARAKMEAKRLDLIVANDVASPGSGFDSDTNRALIMDRLGQTSELPLLVKPELADRVLDRVVELFRNAGPHLERTAPPT
ncbi:MAG: bifunctional phosphopantothenoylcysteine decarboxylase/phosphopantothenate--cysteine ligase CoaBC [Chloroflexi bacterium]|nr:bifunctional phosphopantothenoylcysteine decarboxylase/phosphopantothenate--cysteine ligase CoaBC [Chloroflexota bacterium]